MRAVTHICASTVASVGTFAVIGPAPAAGLLLVGGFMDVDHLGLYSRVGLPMTPSALFSSLFRSEGQIERTHSIRRGVPARWYFPPLHCVEFTVILLLLGLLVPSGFILGAAAGSALHLLMDAWSYPCGPRFFSMLWRSGHRGEVMRAWETH